MSGFEPLFMAAAEDVGATALASEVMAPELLGTLGSEFGTEAAFSGLGGLGGAEGITGLTGLTGLAGDALGSGIGSLVGGTAQSAVPTLAENLAAANPEALAQTQNAILNSQVGANQFTPLTQSQIAEMTNGIPTAGRGVQVAANTPGLSGAETVLNGSTEVIPPQGIDLAPNVQAGSAINTPYQLTQTNPPLPGAMTGTPSALPASMTGEGGNGLMDVLKNAGSKALDWWDKQPAEKQLLYGSAGVLGANALLGKKQGVPTAEKYSGPLSKFHYNKDVYQPYVAQPPSPYTPQYTDYRRYAGGGPIEAMSNANAIGANTGYPMADISKGAYATPYQQPISRNMLSGAADTGVNPITGEMTNFAGGGITNLGGYSDGGRMLKGPGDGMSDDIPATIAGKQPARLANDEFVVPADVVSHLGNGSSDAGAKQLYKMMDRVRQARTGQKKQGTQIKPEKYIPA